MKSELTQQKEVSDAKSTQSFLDQEAIYKAEQARKDRQKDEMLKDYAVTVTHEGLNAFAEIIKNSIQSGVQEMITKSIEPMVKQVVRNEMMQMIEGVSEGFKMFAQSFVQVQTQTVAQQLVSSIVQKEISNVIPLSKPEKEKTKIKIAHNKSIKEKRADNLPANLVKANEARSRKARQRLSIEANAVMEILKNNGKPMQLKDIKANLESNYNIKWEKNITSNRMKQCMEFNPSIQNSNLYGMYEWVENVEE